MKSIFLAALIVLSELALAGPGGTGRLIPTALNGEQKQEVKYLVQSVLSMDAKGILVVQAIDRNGTIIILHVTEDQLVPVGRGLFAILIRVDDI